MDGQTLLDEVKKELVEEKYGSIKSDMMVVMREMERIKSIQVSLDERLERLMEQCENL